MRNSPFPGMAMILMVAVCSCKSNYICPSYESAYILDQPTRHKKFSLFDEDTLPRRDMDADKNKFLVIRDIKYKQKRDEMRTVKMETIFPQVEAPDTLLLAEQDLSPEDMEQLLNEGKTPVNQYNVDQIYYMRHFGQYLPMPEEPSEREQAPLEEEFEEEMLEEPQVKRKKVWQFWKKKSEEVDSLNIGFEEEVVEEERDLSKKELREQERQEQERLEEIERAREPKIMDLEDFEENRGIDAPPSEAGPSRDEDEPKKKKKIRFGFGKKNKTEDVELVE